MYTRHGCKFAISYCPVEAVVFHSLYAIKWGWDGEKDTEKRAKAAHTLTLLINIL